MYRPTEIDLAWARVVLSLVADEGEVTFPSTSLLYKISHAQRIITLQNTSELVTPRLLLLHYRMIGVFKTVGYAVREKPSSVEDATAAFDQHIFECDRCSRTRGMLCIKGEALLENFHQALVISSIIEWGKKGGLT